MADKETAVKQIDGRLGTVSGGLTLGDKTTAAAGKIANLGSGIQITGWSYAPGTQTIEVTAGAAKEIEAMAMDLKSKFAEVSIMSANWAVDKNWVGTIQVKEGGK